MTQGLPMKTKNTLKYIKVPIPPPKKKKIQAVHNFLCGTIEGNSRFWIVYFYFSPSQYCNLRNQKFGIGPKQLSWSQHNLSKYHHWTVTQEQIVLYLIAVEYYSTRVRPIHDLEQHQQYFYYSNIIVPSTPDLGWRYFYSICKSTYDCVCLFFYLGCPLEVYPLEVCKKMPKYWYVIQPVCCLKYEFSLPFCLPFFVTGAYQP